MGAPTKDLTYNEPHSPAQAQPSAAALSLADKISERYVLADGSFTVAEYDIAREIDAFAAQQVAAAVKERDAEIIAALEHQAEVWERMKSMTPSAELRASTYRSAVNIVKQ